MKLTKYITLLLAAIAIPASAATISVLDSGSAINTTYIGGGVPITFTTAALGSFDPTGASKLVVTIGTEHTNSGVATTSVTYNGMALTKAVGPYVSGGGIESAIFYLDTVPATAGDLVITDSNSRGLSATIYALSNTAAGVGNTASDGVANVSLTTTVNDSFVLASTTFFGATTAAAQSPLTNGIGADNTYGGAGTRYSLGTGYQTVATSGTGVTPTFNVGTSTVAVEFLAVPEPSTTALLGLGGLALILRRRK